MGVTLQPQFRKLKKRSCPRYVVVTGGRGSAKSFGVSTICADRVCGPGHRILYTRYTMASADLSIIPEVEQKLELLNVLPCFHVTKNLITNKINGSDIIFRGIKTTSGNQTAALKSLQGVSTWVLDEAEELVNENDFDTIDMSIRAKGQKNQVILILNPTTTEHWIWKRWFEKTHRHEVIDGHPVAISTHPDVLHIHLTYLTNKKHLEESFLRSIEQMKADNPGKYAHRVIGGWLEKAEGVIFDNWQEGEFNDNLPYCYGLDYGYSPDPTAMPKIAVDDKRKLIYAKEIIYQTELDDIPARLEIEEISKRDLIVADLNELRTTAAIRKKGYNIQNAAKGAGSIAQDIRDIKQYTIIVDPDSPNLKKELNNYVWNDKKASIPIDDYNHLMDAMRYAFRRLVRKSKGVKRRN